MTARTKPLIIPLALAALAGCGETSVPVPVEVQRIEGQGLVGRVLNLAGFDFPFSASFVGAFDPRGPVESITFESLALRSVNAEEAQLEGRALTRALLERPEAFDQCDPDRNPVGFIEQMSIFIKEAGDTERAVVAIYERPPGADPDTICGLRFDVNSDLDLKAFLPRYEIEVEATANAPEEDTFISGFTRLLYVTGL